MRHHVNHAGFQQHQESLEDISDEQWNLTFRTNVYGCFTSFQAMDGSRLARPFTYIWTPSNLVDEPPASTARHSAETPMKRPAHPEEIAPTYVFLASTADSRYITGEVVTLLGGETTAG